MAFFLWAAILIFGLWTLVGAVVFTPVFLFSAGIYLLGIFLFSRFKKSEAKK